jgi:plasmid stabilization system protein ParE
MAKIVLSPRAIARLQEIEEYYLEFGREISNQALAAIFSSLDRVAKFPLTGRPQLAYPDVKERELREVSIAFGKSGFIALYRIDQAQENVVILAIRHQRESGYGETQL